MARWPSEFYPGLEDLHQVDPREARRFAVTVLEAAEKHRGVEIGAQLPSGQPSAEVLAAIAALVTAMEGP